MERSKDAMNTHLVRWAVRLCRGAQGRAQVGKAR